MTSKMEEIQENIQEWVDENLDGFEFRAHQMEYISKTIDSIINGGSKLNLIEAPTGSGKSVIVIIMAGVLERYYGKTSYILCSDLYLWKQYSDMIDKNCLCFGKLMGSKGNYTCPINGEDLQTSLCKIHRVPFVKLSNYDWCKENDFTCAIKCHYVRERKRAMASKVTLLTYQLYLHYMNDKLGGEPPFPPRDVVFCDECHNIPSICQQYGTLTFDRHHDMDKLLELMNYCHDKPVTIIGGRSLDGMDVQGYVHDLNIIYNKMFSMDENDKNGLLEVLKEYREHISNVIPIYESLDTEFALTASKPNSKDLKAINTASDFSKQCDDIDTYVKYAEKHPEYVVTTDNKTPDPNNKWKKTWGDVPILSYKFAREDVWVYLFLLKHQSTANVMLSATIGDHEAFDTNIGAHFMDQKKSVMDVIPSTFDFSKSPIYYIGGRKMSQDMIAINFPKNAEIANKIISSQKHQMEKGIIHTGSYKNAKDLYDMLTTENKKRAFIYDSSASKLEVLKKFMMSKNGVLIGPTLTEGIDLPEDGCRFIIIMKVPYPYLGDNLVKAKKDLFPNWYASETSKTVIQGIGRGNRTPNDWSTTYILDGCFESLYQQTSSQYSDDLKKRIIYLKS